MRGIRVLPWLIIAASAGAQAPCARAPGKSATSFFAEPIPSAPKDSLVSVRLCLASARTVGSYMATISFDSSRMRAVRVDARGGMQATNSKVPGVVRIAGAAPSGFPNGELARISFKSGKKTLDRISLIVSEVNSISGASLVNEISVTGWPRGADVASRPVIDSIVPRIGELDSDRVTDITIYGRGFAAVGNLVVFGAAEIPGLKSEAEGTIIRFSAPIGPVKDGKAPIRVKHHGMLSNFVNFTIKDGNP